MKPKSPYPPHVQTVDHACSYIREIFADPSIRVLRYMVEVVTPAGSTMKLTFDHKHVGQKPYGADALKAATLSDDKAFAESARARMVRRNAARSIA